MSITDNAKAYHEKMFPGQQSALAQTDPEFIERFDNFAFDEVVNQGKLDDRTRMMAILVTLLGCQGRFCGIHTYFKYIVFHFHKKNPLDNPFNK